VLIKQKNMTIFLPNTNPHCVCDRGDISCSNKDKFDDDADDDDDTERGNLLTQTDIGTHGNFNAI